MSSNFECMKGLPKSWVLAELSDVCSKITDGTHRTPDYRDRGVRFISIKNIKPFEPVDWNAYERFISDVEHQELIKRCRPEYGDILFPRIGTLGYAKRVDFHEEVSIFVGLGLAKPIREMVLPEYVEYWMNHPTIDKLSRERANGSGRLTLPLEESRKLPMPVAPLCEQERIVQKLDEMLSDLDAGVAELKAAQRKLAQYRQSLLKAAVEGELTADWRAAHGQPQEAGAELLQRILSERRTHWEQRQLAKFAEQGKTPPKGWQAKYPEPVAPDLTDLPSLPEGWVWASLDQLVAESSYGTSVKCGYESSGDPVLRIPNVSGGKLDFSDIKFATESLNLRSEDHLAIGDVLVIRTNGSIGLVGRAAVVSDALPAPYYFASYLLRLRCVETSYTHRWISAALASHSGRRWIEARAASSAGQHNISLSTLLTMPLPLPPLAEQADALNATDVALESAEQHQRIFGKSLAQAAAQRKNILKAAFAGQLVPQDPNDEPASELLARIRTARAAGTIAAARKRGRKAKETA